MKNCIALLVVFLFHALAPAQTFPVEDAVMKRIWTEAVDSSQLPVLAHQLFDVVGPRLVGTPQMVKANMWALDKYHEWGIEATNEQYGTWRGWERGGPTSTFFNPACERSKEPCWHGARRRRRVA